LEKHISELVTDSVALLKKRLAELDFVVENDEDVSDVLKEINAIVTRHHNVQAKTKELQQEVALIEQTKARELAERQQEIVEMYQRHGLVTYNMETGTPVLTTSRGTPILASDLTYQHILAELNTTLIERKKLNNQVSVRFVVIRGIHCASESRIFVTSRSNSPFLSKK